MEQQFGPDHPDRLLLTDEAAQFLRLTPRALENWRNKGDGPPYIRISHRCVRYRLGTLVDWLGKRTSAESPEDGDRAGQEPEAA